MTRYYKLVYHPGWYYKVEGTNAWCIRRPSGWCQLPWTISCDPFSADGPISADTLIKNYELIELTKEQLFLELL